MKIFRKVHLPVYYSIIVYAFFPSIFFGFVPLITGGEKPTLPRFLLSLVLCSIWMLFSSYLSPEQRENHGIAWTKSGLLILFLGILFLGLALITQIIWVTWIAVFLLFSISFWCAKLLIRSRNYIINFFTITILAFMCSYIINGVYALQSNFSDEEFFLGFQTLLLTIIISVLFIVAFRLKAIIYHVNSANAIVISRSQIFLIIVVIFIGFSILVTFKYQKSYAQMNKNAMATNITPTKPYQCINSKKTEKSYDGISVHRKIMQAVIANPEKSTPEYGMLALGTGLKSYADLFHDTLMDEVHQDRFTEPANSIKVDQYNASTRVYYYSRIVNIFPSLFTEGENEQIAKWFRKINKRAMTVEWVDYLYAIPFNYIPQGPYENQENGAGLLALLESEGYADPNLSNKNKFYLAKYNRGWNNNFRNTDDAITYQPMWITNAYYQALYHNSWDEINLKNSFEWLLIQAPPGGSDIQYNHPESTDLTTIAYLGAILTKDARYITLAGYSVDRILAKGGFLFAQPGIEYPIELKGLPISTGSCLLYGNSGLPTLNGPLLPDKIVLRLGWEKSDQYILENLRFNGWHKYKATGTIILYQNIQSLIKEEINQKHYSWLPAGRAQVRDKRISRENLNGLVITKQGFGFVLAKLLGGSIWSQDPPPEAVAKPLEQLDGLIKSTTILENWHGWDAERTIILNNEGLIIVVDRIKGVNNSKAGIFWHISGSPTSLPNRFNLGESTIESQLLLISADPERIAAFPSKFTHNNPNFTIFYRFEGKQDQLITILLPLKWKDASAQLITIGGADSIILSKDGQEILIRIDPMTLEQENLN